MLFNTNFQFLTRLDSKLLRDFSDEFKKAITQFLKQENELSLSEEDDFDVSESECETDSEKESDSVEDDDEDEKNQSKYHSFASYASEE